MSLVLHLIPSRQHTFRFHLMALHAFIRTILTGCTFALPLCVTFPPKPDELLRNVQVSNGITILMTVPSLLEQVARDLCLEKNAHIGLKPLVDLRFILYGGASCPDDICRTLVDHGVTLLGLYGSTGESLPILRLQRIMLSL